MSLLLALNKLQNKYKLNKKINLKNEVKKNKLNKLNKIQIEQVKTKKTIE